MENGYPTRLVNDLIQHKEAKDLTNMVAIPYVAGLFDDLKKELGKHGIRAVAKPDNSLKMSVFSHIKDKTPILQQANVVYEVPCQCQKRYCGRTRQRVGRRMDQHDYHITKKGEQNSGLTEHAIQTGHKPRWSGVRIIYRVRNQQKLNILESIAIKKTTSNLNRQLDSQ